MRSPIVVDRRRDNSPVAARLTPLASLLAAAVLGALLLAVTGHDPIDVYRQIGSSAFGSKRSLSGTLISATPIAFTGLCAAAAFRLGVINVGGEGQLYVGAVGAAWAGIALGGSAPTAVTIAVMMASGAALGALYAGIVGVLRARFATNEIITSLMFNYLAGILLNYLIFNSTSYWRDPRSMGFPAGRKIDARSHWPTFSFLGVEVALGFVVAVVAMVLLWVLYRRTRFGFEVAVLADSPRAGRYAGMRGRSVVVAVMLLSGALAGVGGASDVGDFRHQLDAKGLPLAGYGYVGIVVAALARSNPFAVVPVAVLVGGITNAGYALQGPDFPAGLVGTLQGLLLFTAVAGEVLVRYRIRVAMRESAPA